MESLGNITSAIALLAAACTISVAAWRAAHPQASQPEAKAPAKTSMPTGQAC